MQVYMHILEKRSTKEAAEEVAKKARKTLRNTNTKVIVRKYRGQYGVFLV
jgi:hypothetical protein